MQQINKNKKYILKEIKENNISIYFDLYGWWQ